MPVVIHRIQALVVVLCLLFAQQGAMLHALSHLREHTGSAISAEASVCGHDGDHHGHGDRVCLLCLAYSAMVAAVYVVWPCIAIITTRFLIFAASCAAVFCPRAPQVYAARAPPVFVTLIFLH